MTRIIYIILILSIFQNISFSQKIDSALTISGYAEVYYNYNFNRPSNNEAAFLYNFNRHNEVNLNLGFIKAAYSTNTVRGNFSLAAGTYMNANYAAEPATFKNIFEANIGVKLSKNKEIWLDAGILPSHIGFESAIGKDCWTLSRGLLAENSPYFETGVKLSQTTEKWTLAALLLNGWQRVARPVANSTPSVGLQIQYRPSDRLLLNYSNFIGSDKPDSLSQKRIFNNVYGIFNLNSKISATFGLDIGMEQKNNNSQEWNTWFTPIGIVKFSLSDNMALAFRAEYYSDKNQVIITTDSPNGFKTQGYSMNFDYKITSHALWRIELRHFNSQDAVFPKNSNGLERSNTFCTSSLSLNF